jgi:hypothetical protein
MPRAGLVVLARHEQDHDAQVAGGIARGGARSDLPFAPDLQRHVGGRTVADVGQGHDHDLAARLILHFGDARLEARNRGGVEHAGEVVDIAAGGRQLDLGNEQ